MRAPRRNAITHFDARVVLAVATATGVLAALSGPEPVGETVFDALLTFGLAMLVTWLGASSAWWALAAGAGVVTAASSGSPLYVTVLAAAGMIAALWIGRIKASLPIARAGIA